MKVKSKYSRRLRKLKQKIADKVLRGEISGLKRAQGETIKYVKATLDGMTKSFSVMIGQVRKDTQREVNQMRESFDLANKQLRAAHETEMAFQRKEFERKSKEMDVAISKAESAKFAYFARVDEINKIASSMKAYMDYYREEKEMLEIKITKSLAAPNEISGLLDRVNEHKQKVIKREHLQEPIT